MSNESPTDNGPPRAAQPQTGMSTAPVRPKRYFGTGLPYTELDGLTGVLVVIEGSDGVGRTTQIALLKRWLEVKGFGVLETGWTRSQLVGPTIDLAKAGHAMNRLTFNLLYATDFADRVEHEIIPSLRSGFIVLSDRYFYTALARAAARRADTNWVRSLYGFAIEPDLVLYLKADVHTLLHRVMTSRGLDYWETGMDQNPGLDPYESFCRYQAKVIREFNRLADEFAFRTVNARRKVETIQRDLRKHVAEILDMPLTKQDLRVATTG